MPFSNAVRQKSMTRKSVRKAKVKKKITRQFFLFYLLSILIKVKIPRIIIKKVRMRRANIAFCESRSYPSFRGKL